MNPNDMLQCRNELLQKRPVSPGTGAKPVAT
jgi:hypothetical protein